MKPEEADNNEARDLEHRTKKQPLRRKKSHASLIMVLLTASIIICWASNISFFPIISFDFSVYNEEVDIWTSKMLMIQSVIDRIIFLLALKNVRLAVQKLICRTRG